MNPALNINAVVEYLKEQTDLAAAYLFGSFARNRAGRNSDVDIAILFRLPDGDKFARFERRLDLETALEKIVRRPVQVVDLETASPVLQRQVRKYGILLLEKDHRRRVDFDVRSRRHYFDMQRVYRLRNAAILKSLGD